MRDIAQVSIKIENPYTGVTISGSAIQPIAPEIILEDGFLDECGYLFDVSDVWDDGELFT